MISTCFYTSRGSSQHALTALFAITAVILTHSVIFLFGNSMRSNPSASKYRIARWDTSGRIQRQPRKCDLGVTERSFSGGACAARARGRGSHTQKREHGATAARCRRYSDNRDFTRAKQKTAYIQTIYIAKLRGLTGWCVAGANRCCQIPLVFRLC